MSHIRLFTTILWIVLTAGTCFGSNGACELLAVKATVAQVDVLHLADERDESHRDNSLHAGRAAERLLYIAATCPKQFFSVVINPEPKWLSAWADALREYPTLQPNERTMLITAARSTALQYGAQGRRVAQLLSSVAPTSVRHTPAIQCGVAVRRLLVGLSDDWIARSGALWFNYSDSILFMVASCPEDSYYVLDQRPELMSSWLHELPKASFWGDPKDKTQLRALQGFLIQLLEAENPPEYLRGTRDGILSRIRTLCITVVDETTPCPTDEEDTTTNK